MDGSPPRSYLVEVANTRSPGLVSALFYALFGVLALGSGAGCGGVAADAKSTVLSLEKLDCGECGADLAKALSARDGIHRAVFSLRHAELEVLADPGVDVLAAANAVRNPREHYVITLGGGHGSYEPWQPAPDGLDVVVVSEGGVDVPDLGPHKVLGKVTLIDFGAKWCEPCRMLDRHVLELMKTHPEVAYRKLDVGDWDSPLAAHYMKEVTQLPYLVVFGKDGKKVDEVVGLDTAKLDRLVERARRAP